MPHWTDRTENEDFPFAFRKIGSNVKLFPLAKIVKTEVIEIGDNSMIDDFTFIYGGRGISIGRFVHIASFVSIIGGGEVKIGDYAVLACGARILSGTDTYYGGRRMSTALPPNRGTLLSEKLKSARCLHRNKCNCSSNVHIGEGAVIGSNSLVSP